MQPTMSETLDATPRWASPRVFGWGAGALLLALGAGGFLATAMGRRALLGNLLTFNAPLDVIHVALGALFLLAAFIPGPEATAKRCATAGGTFLLAFAVLGVFSPTLFGYPARLGLGFRLDMIENSAHLILGIWGAYVGTRDA